MVQVFIECKSPEATQCSFAKVRLLKQKNTNDYLSCEASSLCIIDMFEIVSDPKKIEFFVQDFPRSLACPTGPRLTTHATGEARGAQRFIGAIDQLLKATNASG